jgi:hypothetical protein
MKASEAIAVTKNGLAQLTSYTRETAGDLADELEVVFKRTTAEFDGTRIIISAVVGDSIWNWIVEGETIKFDYEWGN